MSIFPQVLAALGTDYFEHLLPDIIRNCSHQRASVRDGYLTLFKVTAIHYIGYKQSLKRFLFNSPCCCLLMRIMRIFL